VGPGFAKGQLVFPAGFSMTLCRILKKPAPLGMNRPEGLFQDRPRALEEPIGLLVPVLQGAQTREAAPAHRRDGMLRAESLLIDCQRTFVERFRLRVPAPGNVL